MIDAHFVIDFETLDVTATAKILSVGAVRVVRSANGYERDGSFYRIVNAASQPLRTCSDVVEAWWCCQSVEARAEVFCKPGKDLRTVLAALLKFLDMYPNAPIWGNGIGFDNAIAQHACREAGLEWPFRRDRCLRTLKAVSERVLRVELPDFPKRLVKHNAQHDAMHEADQLAVMLAEMERMSASAH